MTTPKIEELRASLPKRERHAFPDPSTLEFRADDGGGAKIRMLIPYNTRSVDLGGFVEIVRPSAFRKSLKERRSDVVALWNHDSSKPLGRQSNDALVFRDTPTGLEAVVTLNPKSRDHDEFALSVERRDVIGSSFAFEKMRDDWSEDEDGTVVRDLLEARLYDVSPVTYPAYPDSEAEKRALPFEAAIVRSGVDLRTLVVALGRMEGAHVGPEHRDTLTSAIQRLGALLPAAASVPSRADVTQTDFTQIIVARDRILRRKAPAAS